VTVSLPPLPALVVGRVRHTRFRPLRHSFTNRHYQWLVDLDDLPEGSSREVILLGRISGTFAVRRLT